MTGPDGILSGLRTQGELSDQLLEDAGVVLTQGGEPTFVPEETSAPEWNHAALGQEKLRYSWKLCRELEKTLMPGALILKGNGKHYPGEPIPRWKLTLLKGPGKRPLLEKRFLLADDMEVAGAPVAPRRFLSALALKLGIPGTLRPAYEDVEAAMRAEAAWGGSPPLPRYSRTSRGFLKPRWTTADRARWSVLHRAAGWILPLGREGERWITADWGAAIEGDLRLLPGSSSIGLRLPLHLLPEGTLTCAVTAEIREGALSLFLPPLPDAESFAALLGVIGEVLESLSSPPVRLEGHEPPAEEGWESLTVIPDPGVIEVNLPPCSAWGELERIVTILYAAAERAGLRGVRRLPTGEVVATGGGAHLVLGGPSPAENPFLLKPALLPSFLRFLQNHPSLSYLFSGRFLGPSSQAPRPDESLFEVPRELGRALSAVERMTVPADPAMIDAQLRSLLLDLHGNTHKAEVSVDKFWNPFMPNGRLGLVEFRAIEMAPDAASLLAVHALWRALAAAFCRTPFRGSLTAWGERLHGRCLSPSWLRHDLGEVLAYLREHGFEFKAEWFDPLLNFRFPKLAEGRTGQADWTLRHAAETWPLLGEQPSPLGGVVRCVDSSTERLEIHVPSGSDVAVTVNGRPVPLITLPDGSACGAFRFRTLELPVRLRPDVGSHLPLEIAFHDPLSGVRSVWQYDRPSSEEFSACAVLLREERRPDVTIEKVDGELLDLLDGE